MQFGFISYSEEGNVKKPKKRKFDFFQNIDIRALSLKSLDNQENLSGKFKLLSTLPDFPLFPHF